MSDKELELQIAQRFAKDLRAEIGDDNLREVNRRNATPDYADCCASHDFTDANMVMADAMKSFGQSDPSDHYDEESGGLKETPEYLRSCDTFNEAWTVAKENHFFI